MVFKVLSAPAWRIKSDCLVLPIREGGLRENPDLKMIPIVLRRRIEHLFTLKIITGKEGQVQLIESGNEISSVFVLLVGVGRAKKLGLDSIRNFSGQAIQSLRGKRFKLCVFMIPSWLKQTIDVEAVGQLLAEGIVLGNYEFQQYKSKPDKKESPNRVIFTLPAGWSRSKFRRGLKAGEILAWGQNLARDLTGHPANFLTPQALAGTARALARKYRFSCRVLSRKEIRALKMRCLLAVNQGAVRPPVFIILNYRGRPSTRQKICLVGKGITFDSGGISIKPAQDMDQMKGDMAGAAAVLATMACAVRLRLPLNLLALIPATENLPSGNAFRPGDVLTAMNGKTIEVITTDAEGRLILADALSYAQKQKPQAVIDIATLTGAAIVALGYVSAALYVNNDRLRALLKDASEYSGEKVWELPLWDEYQEQIKSTIADIKNSGGRPGGSCTAAAFLKNFVADLPWAHIDMAAMDIEFKGGAYKPKGASGYGVRLLTEFLRRWK